MTSSEPTGSGPSTADELIASARRGSPEALGALFAGCWDYLVVVASRELPADLQGKVGPSDLVQETLLEAGQRFERFVGGDKAELLEWLRRILLAKLSNAKRRYRRTIKRALDREVPIAGLSSVIAPGHGTAGQVTDTPSRVAMERERREAVDRAIARLPEDYRRAIELRCRDLCSFSEMGRSLGRSADGARKLWFRAVRKLKHEFRTDTGPDS